MYTIFQVYSNEVRKPFLDIEALASDCLVIWKMALFQSVIYFGWRCVLNSFFKRIAVVKLVHLNRFSRAFELFLDLLLILVSEDIFEVAVVLLQRFTIKTRQFQTRLTTN